MGLITCLTPGAGAPYWLILSRGISALLYWTWSSVPDFLHPTYEMKTIIFLFLPSFLCLVDWPGAGASRAQSTPGGPHLLRCFWLLLQQCAAASRQHSPAPVQSGGAVGPRTPWDDSTEQPAWIPSWSPFFFPLLREGQGKLPQSYFSV